jgi:guanidinopropionase
MSPIIERINSIMERTMKNNDIPYIPGRKVSLPKIYGDTPSFLGCPIVKSKNDIKKYDVVFMGVPWEGPITWDTYTGCELAPKTVRHASARYGSFLPEYDIDFAEYIKLGDIGDISVDSSSTKITMNKIKKMVKEIYALGAIPFTMGGDHSFTPEIVRALGESSARKIGIIHFDAHFDNMLRFGGEEYTRCNPLYRIAQIPEVKRTSIVHIGIRGPRNAPVQAEYAKRIGAKVFNINTIHELGMDEVMKRAIEAAYDGTDAVYVTVCSDCMDTGFNPGGPIDFDGLTPHELFTALHQIGSEGIAGLDFVEIYPRQDPNGYSSHLASWAFIHALVGIASRKKMKEPLARFLKEVRV